mgnify:FL=1|jgi:hypothetical protein|tara:strand:- start:575 stop:1513 length:939 start_codon:yes stop_codon:yes gene_type:complete
MAESFLTLTNKVLARLNEVALTSATFSSARGIQVQAQNAVNESVRYVNQKEFQYPFNHSTKSETLVPGTVRYSIPTDAKTVDYNTFRIVKDSDLSATGGRLYVLNYNDYVNSYITQEDEITTTTTSTTHTDSVTTITVSSTTGFDSSGTIFIANEQVTYTGTTSTTFTGCTRGANDTTAASIASGVQVAQFESGGVPQYVSRTPDNNFLLYPFPTKALTLKYDFFSFPSDMSAHGDTTTIPDRFAAVIVDGATAFVYQYRGETTQYQLNMERFEQGIKNMQTLLVNRFEYVRSTFIPKVGYTSTADLSIRVN